MEREREREREREERERETEREREREREREHKVDPCSAPKKTAQNKIRRCNSYTCFISLSAEVIDLLHILI